MKALPRITGVTHKDRVTNDAVNKMTSHVDLDKLQMHSRLRWLGDVQRRENDYTLKSRYHVSVPGTKPAGRPKKHRIDCVKRDLNILALKPRLLCSNGMEKRVIFY